jgi:hypothetical protein
MTGNGWAGRGSRQLYLLAAAAILVAEALTLFAMGRTPICTCGHVKLWHGIVLSSENSQHLLDWYSPSHVIHGFVLYGLFWLVGRRWPVGLRLVLTVLVEGAWEVFENTDFVIERYRAATISLDYYGDSILNSVSDIACCIAGFALARRLPTRVIVALAILVELVVGYSIRDNLTLNIIMLVHPFDVIKAWQAGA